MTPGGPGFVAAATPWSKLQKRLNRLPGARQDVQVTGIAGCGKSYTLARFVLEQRAAGHLVVYIHTAEQFVANAHMPLCYAWRNALQSFDAATFPRTHFFGASSFAPADAAAAGEVHPITRAVNDLWRIGRKSISDVFLSAVSDITEMLNDFAESKGERHCLVIDQDNRAVPR